MGLFMAWAIGESIVFYRWGKLGAPPTPGVVFKSSMLFIGLAVIGVYQPARTAVTVTAFGLDLAILMQVIGKAPTATTGWPPPVITNPAVVIPSKGDKATQPVAAGSSAQGGAPGGSGGGGGTKPWWDFLNPFD